MIDLELTQDAKKLLKLLYAVYAARREEGKSRTEAVRFDTSADIQSHYLYATSADDVRSLCFELRRARCLIGDIGNNDLCDIELTDTAIIYGEQTFERLIKNGLAYISALKGIL